MFKEWLLGRWTNLKQAQSNPTKWSHVYLSYDEEDGLIHCKQWYDYRGEHDPYRERWHRLQYIADDVILVENADNPDCDMLCTFDGMSWNGEVGVDCRIRDAKVESYFRLTENTIECYDIGLRDGIRVFGGRDPYSFYKL